MNCQTEGMLEWKDQEVNYLPRSASFKFLSQLLLCWGLIELKLYHCCLDLVNFHNYKRGESQAYLGRPTIWRQGTATWDYATMRDFPFRFGICNTTGHLLYLKYLYTGQFVKIWALNSHWNGYNWLSTSKKSTGNRGKYFATLNRNNCQ